MPRKHNRFRLSALYGYWLIFKKLVLKKKSYLNSNGWVRSFLEDIPVDGTGEPLPWMNYPMIRFLEERLSTDMDLFEFGSGYSTMFYARFVNTVTSIEYDRNWLERVSAMSPSNAQVYFQPADEDGDYCRAIHKGGGAYHVVVVDGRDRVNCLKQATQGLTEDGVILLDDSHRERYKVGLEYARTNGFRVIEFEGMKPKGYKAYRTAIIYRDGNCLGI